MNEKAFRKYWILSLSGVLLASCYPIYMGISVLAEMLRFGTVAAERYPKYIIPYTPLALALLAGVALIPVMMKYGKKYALLGGSAASVALFFTAELLLEQAVTVTGTATETFTKLENWQMFMCYVPPEFSEERTWTAVDVLLGEYDPAFKLHFYAISVVLILSLLNCFYGFAQMLRTGNPARKRALILQSVAAVSFLGMCIWACFTAFYRDGNLTVSPLSAGLMILFFLLFGITGGIYGISYTLGKKKLLSVGLPAGIAGAIVLLMYVGEMILLSGNLYRFGSGVFFAGIPGIVLAPVDLLVVLLAGGITALLSLAVTAPGRKKTAGDP